MKNNESNFTKKVSAVCLIAAPLLLLTGDLCGFAENAYYWHYFFGKAAFAAFVFAIFALVDFLKPFSERLSVVAGGTAIIGAISGATLFSFGYLDGALAKNGFEMEKMPELATVLSAVYQTMVFAPLPGLFFPIGLLILSINLFRVKAVPRAASFALAFGAVLFPAGRIPGVLQISVASDLFLNVALVLIGWRILRGTKILNESNPRLTEATETVAL